MLRSLLILLLLAAPSAWARLQPDDRIAPGEGAVLLTVSINVPGSANENAMPGLIPQITVERVDGDKHPQYVLANRLQGLVHSRAYGGSLPPGRYRIYDLMGTKCRMLCGINSLSKPKGDVLGEFVVEAGRVRYLGAVLVSAHPPSKPGGAWVVYWGYTRSPDVEIGRRLLQGLYPELAGAAAGELVAGWEPAPDGGARSDAEVDRIRRESTGFSDPNPYGDRGFLFGANNGVVRRAGVDDIALIDTGSPFMIRSAIRTGTGRMLAGGEATTLLYSPDDGRSWKDAAAGLPYGIVLQIRSLGGEDAVFLLQHGQNAALYRGRLGDNAWTLVGDWPMEFKFWTGLPGLPPEMQLQGRKLALTLPSKAGVFVDLDTGESHPMNMPGSIGMLSYSADGVLRCGCFRTIVGNPWESRDEGRTWTPSSIDRWIVLPAFRDASNGFSYKGAIFSKSKMLVVHTADGGATWTETPPPVAGGWWKPYYAADGRRMALVGLVWIDDTVVERAYRSDDGGTAWTQWTDEGRWLYPR